MCNDLIKYLPVFFIRLEIDINVNINKIILYMCDIIFPRKNLLQSIVLLGNKFPFVFACFSLFAQVF